MFALITSFGLFLTETAHAESGFTRFYNEYLNIPGFEAWKFFNLAVFIFAAYYITKKKKLPECCEARSVTMKRLICATRPLSLISPLEGRSNPAIIRKSDDFPTPFGPVTTSASPLFSSKVMSLKRRFSPRMQDMVWPCSVKTG